MSKKKTLEHEINDFLTKWDQDQMMSFIEDIWPLFELYNVDEHDDWVKDRVGKEEVQNIRLIRTVYLVSKIAENHASLLCALKINFKNLSSRLEQEANLEKSA